jgi:hypothetical protein
MADQKAKVEIIADASKASREFDTFGAKVTAVSGSIKSTMGGIQGAAQSLHGQFMALSAAVGAGAFLVGVRHQIDLMDATRKSAQAAGVSAQTFSEMAYAAKLADVESDVLAKSMGKLANQIYKAASGDADMKALFGDTLKVKVREAGGAIRETDKVLEDIAGRFESMDDGAKKIALSIAIFGEKMGPRLIPFLNQGKGGIIELREELKKLKGELTDDQAAAAEQFNDNMTRAGVAAERLKFQIANDALPTLVEYSNFFVEAAKNVGTLEAAWLTFGKAVARITGADDLGHAKSRYADLAAEATRLKLIMIGVQNTLDRDPGNAGALRYMTTLTAKVRELQKAALEASAEIARIASGAGEAGGGRGFVNPTAVGKRKGDQTGDLDVTPKVDNRMAAWEVALAKQKLTFERMQAAQGTFHQFSKEEEAAYWKAILTTLSAADKERYAVEKKYLDLSLELGKARFEGQQAELLTRIDAAKGNYAEQEGLAQIYSDRMRDHYGADSKEFQASLKMRQGLYRAHMDSLREQDNIRSEQSAEDQLEQVGAMMRAAQLERDLGLITQMQLLDVRRKGLELSRAIELEAKQAEIKAMEGNPFHDAVALEKLEAELAGIRRKYRGLTDQNESDKKVEKASPLESILGVSESALESGLTSMVTRMKITLGGIKDVMRSIGTVMLQELVTKPIAAWIVGQARMVAMTWLFGEQKVAAEAAAAGQTVAIQGASTLEVIGMKAYEAAASAYAAIAGIPYVGPVLAPVAAGVALAGVMAFAKSMFSAEQGFDIPGGINPVVQTHAREMILPAKHADTMRALGDIVASGGQIGSGGGSGQVVLKATPLKGNFFIVHRDDMVAAFKSAKRDFAL